VTPGQVGNGEIKGGQAIYGRASYDVLATRASYALRLRFSSDYLSDHLTVGREEVQDVYV